MTRHGAATLCQRARAVLATLRRAYPDVGTALHFSDPLQLLVATILSAQCTDERVNRVTEQLFRKYRTAGDYASADPRELERDIHSTGFFRAKARNIIGAAQRIIAVYGGKVPDTMEQLVTLPGVARKTANIVLSHGFGKIEGIAVDTHVRRLSYRIGLSNHDDPETIEQDLMLPFERTDWPAVSDLLIAHGRAVCTARSPRCTACTVQPHCLQRIER